jgi:hypothetical protein
MANNEPFNDDGLSANNVEWIVKSPTSLRWSIACHFT